MWASSLQLSLPECFHRIQQLEVKTPHPASARVGWKRNGSTRVSPPRPATGSGNLDPASARVGWKLKSRLSSPLEKAEGKTNDIARSGTTMRATSKAGAMCLVVAVANMLGPGTSTTTVWFLKVRRCCRTVSGGSAISLLASERARSFSTPS